MTIRETYPAVADMVSLYCNVNAFDLDGLRKQVHKDKWLGLNPSFKDDFAKVIGERMFAPQEYLGLTEDEFETAEEVAEHLEKVFNFVYHGGPHP